MQNMFIEKVVDYLNEQGFVKEDVDLAKHMVQEKFRDQNFIIWNIDDVKVQALNHEIKLTDEEARDILDTTIHRFDANIGISWDVIDVHITQR